MLYFLSFYGNLEVFNKISYLSIYDISHSISDRGSARTFLGWEEWARIRSVAIGWASGAQPALPEAWHGREILQNTFCSFCNLVPVH